MRRCLEARPYSAGNQTSEWLPGFGAPSRRLLAWALRDCPLAETVAAESRCPVEIDLKSQTIVRNNNRFNFVIDRINRNQLHKDCDNVDLTKSYRNEITAFRGEDRNRRPGATLPAQAD